MRRRSERKKSTDASPAPPATRRTSRRSRRSPDIEKHSEDEARLDKKDLVPEDSIGNNAYERASSEERQIAPSDLSQTPSRKSSRSSRKRTPLSDRSSLTPTKKRSQRDTRSPLIDQQQKVDTIPEEAENGDNSTESVNEDGDDGGGGEGGGGGGGIDNVNKDASTDKQDINLRQPQIEDGNDDNHNVAASTLPRKSSPPLHADDEEDESVDTKKKKGMESDKATSVEEFPQHREVTVVPLPSFSSKAIKGEELKTADVLDIRTEDVERDCADADDEKGAEEQSQKKRTPKTRRDSCDEREREQVKEGTERTNSKRQTNGGSDIESKSAPLNKDVDEQKENIEHILPEALESSVQVQKCVADNKESDKVVETITTTSGIEENKNTTDAASCQRSARKRRWITKKVTERNAPILAISTDSLKNIIADVTPVPLSDVQLETSSEEEGVISDREDDEHSTTPERSINPENRSEKSDRILLKRKESFSELNERVEKSSTYEKSIGTVSVGANAPLATAIVTASASANKAVSIGARSPSPARNRASSVLYITNLVRPFTVLQLKGLLARTGKIVENGFWIDRIKSKCYVEYETEDEAIETRHALHGVRWPISNPKCLNVDFGSKANMERVIQSTKEEAPKFAQDNIRESQNAGPGGWSRNEVDDKKNVRPVREWDVGKKASIDREKNKSEKSRRSKERDGSRSRDNERIERERDRDRDRKQRPRSRERRSRSNSPARKVIKKENEPPIRLLDDLFRKTKVTPCIYWLSLTPEQIAEKEAFRQKRIEEHKQRVKNRELEREKERERERERQKERERDREGRERNKRHRSNDRDRRRSRSRDRRRY